MTATTIAGGPGDFMTVRLLEQTGSQEAIGARLAAEARTAYGWAPVAADPRMARARCRWFAEHWPQHHARIAGAADALSVSVETHHLDGLTGVPRGSACTVTFLPPSVTKEGHGLFGRNYDFFTTSATELFALLSGEAVRSGEAPMASRPYVLRTPGVVALTMNELDGCMEGVNSAGVTVALLIADAESASAPVPAGPQVGLSPVQLPRFVLDTCGSAEEARTALLHAKQYDLGTPLHYLIADASGDAFVWERAPGGAEYIHDLADGPLCLTNHPLHRYPAASDLPPDNEETMRTFHRYRTIAEEVGEGLQSAESLREALSKVAITAATADGLPARTLWRSVFDVPTATMSTHFYLGDAEDGIPRYSEELSFRAG
ncbi:hypothetical protein GCM10027445_11970 [Amycolatopsis endophytica]|uniref:Peptidase C45 hydrolase domain-containing protein n=1 Tax=Amycolatopsis endophytica TaxID=860233 RepID=A0A853B3F2_9PSEU|nr:C45 family autoproteolytic acyltransferase/hydolase [Amycolatopsis endophytica]NYI89334.1 hypothetical protein [Amycolatopsis endophytica]